MTGAPSVGTCPACAGKVSRAVSACPHCGQPLTPTEHADGTPIAAPPPAPPDGAPPRKPSNGIWILGLIGVVVLLGVLTNSDNNNSSSNSSSDNSRSTPSRSETAAKDVTYRVHGTAARASLTLENDSGGTEQKTVSLPWSERFTFRPGDFVYVSAQNEGESGRLECAILVGGREVFTSESSGAYSICTASGSVP